MKHIYDKTFKYTPSDVSKEPNYLWNKFKPLLPVKSASNVKPIIRVKTK